MNSIRICTIFILISWGLVGCTVESVFEPRSYKVTTVTKFYSTLAEVEEICGKGNAGCTPCNEAGDKCWIYAYNEYCVYHHEVDHTIFGPFHGDKPEDCRARAR